MRVTDGGAGLQFRESLGPSQALPFGDGLALLQPRVLPVTDTETGELLAEIEIGVVDGKPGVVAIRARGVPLTSGFLRKLPSLPQVVADVVQEATVRLAQTPQGEIIGERLVRIPQRPIRDGDQIVGTAFGHGRLDDNFLRMVADVYREAEKSGLSTQREIQRQLGPISDAGARRWVKQARDKGFLGEALGPWKAGEKG